jgi:hypothetical protein
MDKLLALLNLYAGWKAQANDWRGSLLGPLLGSLGGSSLEELCMA